MELHEGKEIPNTLGDFFKKCLDSSKFLKKSVPKETAEPSVTEIAPQTKLIEPPSKNLDSTVSSGFQEQFLNSLSKLGSENTDLPIENEIDKRKSEENTETDEKDSSVEEKGTEKIEVDNDEDVIINESISESVICISDSEEEKDIKGSRGNYTLYIEFWILCELFKHSFKSAQLEHNSITKTPFNEFLVHSIIFIQS